MTTLLVYFVSPQWGQRSVSATVICSCHSRQIGCLFPEALSLNDKSIHYNDLFLKYFPCLIHLSSLLQDLINAIVTAAEASADNLIRSEGRDIQLQESLDLHLPFLLPEGGYSCDTVRGIPPGLREFLEPICRKGIGFWMYSRFKIYQNVTII